MHDRIKRIADGADEVPEGFQEMADRLDHMFKYHPPKGAEQVQAFERIREAGREFAYHVALLTPECSDQELAIQKIRETVMLSNAAIALEPVLKAEDPRTVETQPPITQCPVLFQCIHVSNAPECRRCHHKEPHEIKDDCNETCCINSDSQCVKVADLEPRIKKTTFRDSPAIELEPLVIPVNDPFSPAFKTEASALVECHWTGQKEDCAECVHATEHVCDSICGSNPCRPLWNNARCEPVKLIDHTQV